MPAAAKIMEERGVWAVALGTGTGKDGRVTKGDVLAFLGAVRASGELRPPPQAQGPVARRQGRRMRARSA